MIPLRDTLFAGAAPVASPRLLRLVDEDHVPGRIVGDEAVHVDFINLHEAMHPPVPLWVRVEGHLEDIGFSRSTLREGPLAVQTPPVEETWRIGGSW